MNILSSLTHSEVFPNLYECVCSEHKGRYSEERGKQSSISSYYRSQCFPKQPDYKLSSEYLHLCSEQTHSYRFRPTWEWVIFGWTVPLRALLVIWKSQVEVIHNLPPHTHTHTTHRHTHHTHTHTPHTNTLSHTDTHNTQTHTNTLTHTQTHTHTHTTQRHTHTHTNTLSHRHTQTHTPHTNTLTHTQTHTHTHHTGQSPEDKHFIHCPQKIIIIILFFFK